MPNCDHEELTPDVPEHAHEALGPDPDMEQAVLWAKGRIAIAEKNLACKLSNGQRRDLLMDNTFWSSDFVKKVVDRIHPIDELPEDQQEELYEMFAGMDKYDAITTLLAWLEHSQLAEILEGLAQCKAEAEAIDAGG